MVEPSDMFSIQLILDNTVNFTTNDNNINKEHTFSLQWMSMIFLVYRLTMQPKLRM